MTKKGSKKWIASLIIGLAVVGASAGLYFYFKGKNKPDGDAETEDGEPEDQDYGIPPIFGGSSLCSDGVTPKPSGYIAAKFPLAIGMEGNPVKTLQRWLNLKHKANLTVDGKWGCKTQAVVKSKLNMDKISSEFYMNTVSLLGAAGSAANFNGTNFTK